MKLFQINFLSILLLLLLVAVLVVAPSFFVQMLWNSFYADILERDLTINIFQAGLLWGAVLSLIYMTGIIKIDFQTVDSIDLDSIDNPELREKIKELRDQKAAKKGKNKGDKANLKSKQREEIIEHLKRSFNMTSNELEELKKSLKEDKNQSADNENTNNDDDNSSK
jgi:hypothetical protein